MKPNVMEKLYDKTPADTLATLATGALLRTDSDELRRIFAGIEGRSSTSQARFCVKHHAVMRLLMFWALDCQKTYSMMLEMSCCILGGDLRPMGVIAAELQYQAVRGRLASLISAMRQVCQDGGIDFEDVANFVGLADMARCEDVFPIPSVVDELVDQYRVISCQWQ